MAKRKTSLKAIPFFSKYLQKKRLVKLSREADKLADKMCKLTDDIGLEKNKAAALFPKVEYDRITADVDKHLDQACDCVGSGGGSDSGDGSGSASKEARKKCREDLGIKADGAIPKDKKPSWEDCVKKKGGTV